MRRAARSFVVLGVIAAAFVPASPASAQVDPGSCASAVSGDFDADGSSDLAVGVIGQEVDGESNAGAVHVFYGDDPSGIDPSRDDVITQDSPGVGDVAEAGDRFGSCLAAADYNGDGESDLAIGIPGENVGSRANTGAVEVIYGNVDGLDAIGPPADDFIHEGSTGIVGSLEEGDGFGSALGAGDFDGDGRDDLAVGSPFDDVVDIIDAGAVNVMYGANGGLTPTGDRLFHQNANGMAEKAERRDEFGASLAAGDMDGSGDFDLAIGVPGESVGTIKRAGAVQLVHAAGSGLSASTDVVWHQARSGVAGDGAETSDRFATSVAIGDFDADGFGDLAAGTPQEDVGAVTDAGALNVLYGSATGITASGDLFVTQDTSTGATGDAAESGDVFASSLIAADFEDDGEGDDDLAAGAPGEDTGAGVDVGAVDVMYGDDPNGLDAVNAEIYTQDVPVTMDDAEEANDEFGSAVGAGDLNGDAIADLSVGAPGEDIGTEGEAGAVSVVYGDTGGLDPAGVLPDLFLHQDSGTNDDAESGDRFGSAVG
jgi:hypothetical protein